MHRSVYDISKFRYIGCSQETPENDSWKHWVSQLVLPYPEINPLTTILHAIFVFLNPCLYYERLKVRLETLSVQLYKSGTSTIISNRRKLNSIVLAGNSES